MPPNRIKQSGSADSSGTPQQNGAAETVGVDLLIEQAEAVKASLREAAAHVAQLVTSLKRHRKQAKSVQIALIAGGQGFPSHAEVTVRQAVSDVFNGLGRTELVRGGTGKGS